MVRSPLTSHVTELRMEQRTMTDKSDPTLTLILLILSLCLFSVVDLGYKNLLKAYFLLP